MHIQFRSNDEELIARVLKQGCRWIRLALPSELTDEEARPQTGQILKLCRERNAVLIIDDRPELARAVEADGVHITDAQADIGDVRRRIDDAQLLGATCATLDDAIRAKRGGADYIDLTPEATADVKAAQQLVIDLYEADVILPLSATGELTPDALPSLAAAGLRGVTTANPDFFSHDVWAFIDKLA